MVSFETGTFIVNSSGEVEVDFLMDGGWFRGELAIFSLNGMEAFEPGNNNRDMGGAGENGYSIDDVRLYNRALTAEEISLLFNPNEEPEAVNDTTVTVENTGGIRA